MRHLDRVLINFAFRTDVRAHLELIIKSVLWRYAPVMEFRWDMMKDASAFEWYELWIDNATAIWGMERWMRRDFWNQRRFRLKMIISGEYLKERFLHMYDGDEIKNRAFLRKCLNIPIKKLFCNNNLKVIPHTNQHCNTKPFPINVIDRYKIAVVEIKIYC